MRFLAVDDDPTFLDVLRNFMEAQGEHRLCTAQSGQEALELVQKAPGLHDGFLLDIFMPGMNGIELCQRLRAMVAFRHVPIIMLTVASQRHMIDDAFVAGATDYLLKPLDARELDARLTMAVRLHEKLQHVGTPEGRAHQGDSRYPRVIDYDAPMVLRGVEHEITYQALGNYLVTLDRRGLIAHAVFAVHFESASQVYVRADATGFVEALGEVARSISSALEGHKFIFAYAGAGDFVVVALRPWEIDRFALEAHMNASLAKLSGISAVKGLPAPQVRVGHDMRNGLFTERSAQGVLQQAIRSARSAAMPTVSQERDLLRLRQAMKQ